MRVISGMRPTGRLHLGHYFGVVKNWISLQEEHETIFFIADWHALTTAYKKTSELQQNIKEVMLDWIALGIDPKKSLLFIQSRVKQHAELFLLFSMITPKSWLEWNPTYKDTKYNLLRIQDLELQFKGGTRDLVREFLAKLPYKVEDFEALEELILDDLSDTFIRAVFEGYMESDVLKELNVSKRDFYDTDTYGFLGYPVLQAVDILIYKASAVPVGEDQLPHIELTREIARRFNHLYGETFPEPQAILTETPKLVGIDGRKMSKSYNNAIYFADTKEEVQQKVMRFFTDPQKLRKGDPGRPEICPVFMYHKLFTYEEKVYEIERDCRSGKLGCVECKRIMFEGLERFLEPIRERRESLRKDIDQLIDIFEEGSKKARQIASKTLEEVREKMNLL
ncbi:tryptophanyl-tRNA synthetase [Hydrogenobacter thermophilus TK-6]|uniref:Tryptophan--tRNA ligase n=1 Tax=Hydrogenobacter thermophilus (strain DSM 6534 / IAM 12695 / TK-6) TaxID=608538 RepID=D3DI59_HYDTT|nr:tryptophan--tRNA ligase [Hydrogenobacter thermophilus]ADO45440.1 tryptophanyl-tRNA synthetase [Hydrogenobacter thermophilus TK-6]BAI69511.1 tryptophanyl-tRNA synthetase [Hydrogenobacter thermophilus TK-6]